jgi:hypothetical protein
LTDFFFIDSTLSLIKGDTVWVEISEMSDKVQQSLEVQERRD